MAWDTTVRGRNLRVIELNPEEMAELYGPPLTGRAKVEAEMESVNEDRTFQRDTIEEWELE